MSEQPLDLRRSLRMVRRHKIMVMVFAALGTLACASYTMLHPPMPVSNALVVLPPSTHNVATQVVIATSDPVLADVLRRADLSISAEALRSRVQVEDITSNVLSINAQGTTAAQAESTANAVADSYVAYVTSPRGPGQVQARVLELATNADEGSLALRLVVTGALGALLGALIGAVIAIAISRKDRRLRERDEIAGSIGIPVLASIPVARPSDASGWAKLFEEYRPGALHAWSLRRALHHLGLTNVRGENGASLAILTLSSDRRALALGPQLAVYSASLGIPTTLVVGPHQDASAIATLRAACAVPPPAGSRRSSHLQVNVMDHDGADWPHAGLTVVVAVVDARTPQVAKTMRTTVAVLGVSAGAATAEELARVAASAADDGRQIAGILMADPDTTDHTTGSLPQLPSPVHRRLPTRAADATTETRR
jgi:capsular polysaccharide biosynthesis protein